MSAELAILVPVLNRPHRVAPLIESVEATTPGARLLFIADPDDRPETEALEAAGATWIAPGGNYAEKITEGVDSTIEPLIFTAADDLEPRPGWFEAASARLGGGCEIVGVNDLIERTREHATHFLMTRSYAEMPTIDGEPGPFHHGYAHWSVDDELIATARHRNAYAYAPDAHVKHLHHMNGEAPDDETYQKGRARWRQDRRLFMRRRRLWK